MEQRLFYNALAASFLIHLSVIGYLSTSRMDILRRPIKDIEVIYRAMKSQEQNPLTPARDFKIHHEKEIRKIQEIPSRKLDLSPFLGSDGKSNLKVSQRLNLSQKDSLSLKTFDTDRKISIPMFKAEKITNTKYLSYNDLIHQKLNQVAHSYDGRIRTENGTVYLTFIMLSDGSLKTVKIKEEKTKAGSYLRSMALRFINESAPFPPLPRGLNYPELPFSVLVEFRE